MSAERLQEIISELEKDLKKVEAQKDSKGYAWAFGYLSQSVKHVLGDLRQQASR